MKKNIIKIDEAVFKDGLKTFIHSAVKVTHNTMQDKRSESRANYRNMHNHRIP